MGNNFFQSNLHQIFGVQRHLATAFWFNYILYAENIYVDEESEDNDSEEEGDIDEDMMDIDWDDRRTFGLSYIVKLSVIVGTTENKVLISEANFFHHKMALWLRTPI